MTGFVLSASGSRRRSRSLTASLAGALATAVVTVALPVGAHPNEKHGGSGGHLPASAANVELVGWVSLTEVNGGIADVAAHEGYAYLAAFHPECVGRSGAQGTGVHVVDISDPAAPTKVAFLPAEANSYVGEGVHIVSFAGRDLLLHNNETCDSTLPVTSGVSLWDVTDPTAAVKLGQFGDTAPAISNQTFHTTHSVQAFVWQDRIYAVATDNQDLKDVDIFDLTDLVAGSGPAVLVSETGLEDWPGAHSPLANGDSVFHHDMQQKVIDGHNYLLASYWDAGQVMLAIDDPANPVFVTDSDFSSPDPETGLAVAEGNSHQSYWSQDGSFVLSTDEDFQPYRTLFTITGGPAAGAYGAGEFGWTVPIANRPGGAVSGDTVYGGSGCTEDVNGNGTSDRAEIPSASSTGAEVIVFGRGTCFFSTKVESGQLAGYDTVVIGNSHAGSRHGLLPDAFVCGAQGHSFTVTATAICVGHRALHRLFDDAPDYSGPDLAAGGDLPAIGTLGRPIHATTTFDGWGYVHLHDGDTLAEIDTYAIPEALDPAYASGYGNLTVHEVKTDPRPGKQLAYASWYDAGLRVLAFGAEGLSEVGHYISEDGNDFWGVYPVLPATTPAPARAAPQGLAHAQAAALRPLILASDRDSGLWIFRYTGQE